MCSSHPIVPQLGDFSYYFIVSYFHISQAMVNLLKKDVPLL